MAENGDADDVDNPTDIPDHLWSVIQHCGYVEPPEGAEHGPKFAELMSQARCIACGRELGEETMVVLNRNGVIAMFCAGACLQDSQIIGWVQEVHADLIQALEFRGSQSADEGDEDES